MKETTELKQDYKNPSAVLLETIKSESYAEVNQQNY